MSHEVSFFWGPKVKKRYTALFIALLILILGYSQRDRLVTGLLLVGMDRPFFF